MNDAWSFPKLTQLNPTTSCDICTKKVGKWCVTHKSVQSSAVCFKCYNYYKLKYYTKKKSALNSSVKSAIVENHLFMTNAKVLGLINVKQFCKQCNCKKLMECYAQHTVGKKIKFCIDCFNSAVEELHLQPKQEPDLPLCQFPKEWEE